MLLVDYNRRFNLRCTRSTNEMTPSGVFFSWEVKFLHSVLILNETIDNRLSIYYNCHTHKIFSIGGV